MNKTLYYLALLALSACTQAAHVDPRDQYVGTYTIYMDSVNLPSPGPSGAAQMTICKGAGATDLVFTDRSTYRGIINGSTFEILPYQASLIVNGHSLLFDITGSGSFRGKSVDLTQTLTGNDYTGVITASGKRP